MKIYPSLATKCQILTITELNQSVRNLLENGFATLWVEGEISNFSKPGSGHWYFTLKDPKAQVRCAMFILHNRHVPFKLENGLHVIARAKVSLYEGRGDFQLIVEHLEEAGFGALQRAFEALKARLAKEGLFDLSRKLPLPRLPKCIGIITSPSGAAIRDILSVLKRRFISIPIIIYPTAVQGQNAPPEIIQAIVRANQQEICDLLVLARGGGSLEDLWSFNDEGVARAICASHIPIISGVGHEIDTTIADFAASQRAATPTAAAELATPDSREWQHQLTQLKQRMQHLITQHYARLRLGLNNLQKRLRSPQQFLLEHTQNLDRLEIKLQHHFSQNIQKRKLSLHQAVNRLQQLNPQHAIKLNHNTLTTLLLRLDYSIKSKLEHQQQQLYSLSRALDAISPLATLQRGYAIATKVEDNKILHSVHAIHVGAQLKLRLAQGRLVCKVEEIADVD